jgi:HTH-type transcriptional regulator / antitoxin MqsA
MFKCHVCNSEEHRTEYVNDGKFYLVEHIPATVCFRCSEKIFSRETTEHIRSMLHGETKPIKSISVDVFSYQL